MTFSAEATSHSGNFKKLRKQRELRPQSTRNTPDPPAQSRSRDHGQRETHPTLEISLAARASDTPRARSEIDIHNRQEPEETKTREPANAGRDPRRLFQTHGISLTGSKDERAYWGG